MIVGPLFTRELSVAPRRPRLYVARATYVAVLLLLVATAWLLLAGSQVVRGAGDFARFGATVFQILAPLQFALCLFFSAVRAASDVAQEKERRTFLLLLLTRLGNAELVLGKLLASLLFVFTLLAAAAPLFMLTALFGGVSFAQIGWVFVITFASSLVAGSIGALFALWREKTFQALGLTLLTLVVWLGAGEAAAHGRSAGSGSDCPSITGRLRSAPGEPCSRPPTPSRGLARIRGSATARRRCFRS